MTTVTLKKAAAVARAAQAAAKQVKVEPCIVVSVYEERPAVAAAGKAIATGVAQAVALTEAQFALRGLVGEANARSGLNSALTDRAMLDALIGTLEGIESGFAAAARKPRPEVALLEAAGERERLRNGGDAIDYGERTVTMRVFEDHHHREIRARIARLRERRNDLNDRIAGLNLNTSVTIPAAIVDVLTDAGVLAR